MADLLGVSELPSQAQNPSPLQPVEFEKSGLPESQDSGGKTPKPFCIPEHEPLTETNPQGLTGMEPKKLAALRHQRLQEGEFWMQS